MIKYFLEKTFDQIKFAYQRVVRGYDDRAVWDYDYWFLDINYKIFDQFIKTSISYPHDMTPGSWADTLNKIKDCLHEANEDTCSLTNEYSDQYSNQMKSHIERLMNGSYARVIDYEDKELGEKYRNKEEQIFKYRDKNMKEALDLIKKHFWSLWD